MDKTKLIAIISAITLLVFCIFLIVSVIQLKLDIKNTQKQLNSSTLQMKQLEDSIIRSQSSYATVEDLENTLSNLNVDLSAIQKDLDNLNANLRSINSIKISTPGYTGTKLPSTSSKPNPNPFVPEKCIDGVCTNPDKFGYLNKEQILFINEPFGEIIVPFGSTSFKAWEEKPWSLDVLPRNYFVTNIISQDEEGRDIIYNKFEIEVNGKKYPVNISKSETLQKVPESEFWFNPRLYLGVGVGPTIVNKVSAEVIPYLDVSLFSYGKNKAESTWTFLGLGLGMHAINKTPALTLNPVSYNVGEPLPLVDNLFIGPSVSVDTEANVSVFGSIRVGL